MTRRRRIVLSSAAALIAVFVLVVGVGSVAVRTDYGQERVRAFLSAWLSSKVRGSMYVGRVRGGFFGGVIVDSLEIRDDRGGLFVASGRARVRYDLRDLFDKRILLRHIDLQSPVVQLRQYHDGSWNFRRIFPGGQPAPIGGRGFGDFVVLDSARIANGRLVLALPWRAPENASGTVAARMLAEALADTGGHVSRTAHGPVRTWRWDALNARLGRTRLAHPDTGGRLVNVLQLGAITRDPPFAFSDVSGVLQQRGDSIWFNAPRWRLPGSEGSAAGRVRWGGGRPVRYQVRVQAARASLSDIAWIHPTFPRAGGGRARVDIRNAAHDESIIEYAVSEMDVRTHGSRLLGRMVVDPSGSVLAVRSVDVRAAPLDFDLLRVLNGGPLTYDWQGSFTGTVNASGGRVDRFRVERADLTFVDGHVAGAVSSATASGVIDIFEPAFTVFHGLRLNVARLDLRTPRAVIPEFPQVSGFVSGTATLDSSWLDVRFRDADLVHTDGDGPVSHVTGSGRVTLGDPYLEYDLDLFARQLSLTTLGGSYPDLPVRGEFTGPIRVRGEAPRLSVSTALDGESGRLVFDGIVDADAPVYGAEGRGSFAGTDLRRLVRTGKAPTSTLTGRYDVAFTAADLPSAAGTFAFELDTSRVTDVELLPSFVRGEVRNRVVTVDTAHVAVIGGTLSGTGSVALDSSNLGSLRFSTFVDSLAAVATLFAGLVDSVPSTGGQLSAIGELRTGSAFGLSGGVTGSQLVFGEQRAERLRAQLELVRAGGRPSGTISLTADSLAVSGLNFTRAELAASLPPEREAEGSFTASLHRPGGGVTHMLGRLAQDGDTSRVHLDSLFARVDSVRAYRATSPSTIRVARRFATVDSLILAPVRGSGTLAIRDLRWSRDSIAGTIQSRDADLALLSGLLPGLTEASGPVSLELSLAGSSGKPRAHGALRLTNGVVVLSGARYERLSADVMLSDTLLEIRSLSAETPRGGGRRGSAVVKGTIDLSDSENPVFNLEANARSFRALNRRGVATLDISTGPALLLFGPYRGAVLRGSVIVDEGTIYLPERLDKDIADLDDPDLLALVDTSRAESRTMLPSAPSAFISNLRLDDVNVVIGEDVWLRSSEANVELGGSLRVTRGRSDDDDRTQLALVGTLNAVRGTYVLNLAVVQPTFHVERGTLRFFGTPDVNPTLDIRAIHTVRQPRHTIAREDVRILATITGTLRTPELSLSSADNLALSQSDLLSYLVTGEPAFALTGSSTEYAEQLLTIGGRLAGTLISARIPRSVFDIVEVRTGAVRLESGSSSVSSSYLNTLYNTRVILGKQLSEKWYVGLSTGLCRTNFTEGLGLHLEYRLSQTYFAQGGIEPGSGDLACVGTTTARTFQHTPPQLGVDLFRSWRF